MKKNKRGSQQSVDVSCGEDSLRHCQNRVRELEQENESYKKEIEELRHKLSNVSSTLTESAQKLKEDYLLKLTVLEDQVADLKNKLEAKSQFSVLRPKGDESTRQMQYEIQSLKTQKVQLQCKLKVESLQFRLCKASLEKEVLQIKRDSRRNQFELHKQLDSNQRLKMVLQRKTAEASMTAKRLKELLESRKALGHKTAGARNGNNQRIQGLEHELEVARQLHEFTELCSEYERQLELMAEERAKLKEEVEVLKEENSRCLSQEKDVRSPEEDPDIQELKEQVLSLSGLVRQLKLQKAELHQGSNSQDVSSDTSGGFSKSDQSVKDTNTSGSKKSKPSSTNKSTSSVCCSCSKKSLCKTTKCKCRHMGGSCGTSCGCAASKCTNREAVSIQLNDSPQSQISEAKTDSSTIVETVKGTTSPSQGEMTLPSALLEAPPEKIDNIVPSKKPLSDIGNIRLRPTRKIA